MPVLWCIQFVKRVKSGTNLIFPEAFPMRKNTIFTLFSFLFIIIVIGRVVIVAQAPITGTWTANARDEKDGKINLNLERRSTNGSGHNQMGKSYDYSELQGLSANPNGKVSFRLVREAGNIDFQGEFVNGRGYGNLYIYTQQRIF